VQILDGKTVAASVLAGVKTGVQAFSRKTGITPTLAVVLVGDFPPSKIYVRNKKKAADEAGIGSRDYLFPEGCTQDTLLGTLREINADPPFTASCSSPRCRAGLTRIERSTPLRRKRMRMGCIRSISLPPASHGYAVHARRASRSSTIG
jgi:hypothetical protein